MHIEDDIAREGEADIAARHHQSYEEELDRRIDLICSIIAVAVLVSFAVAMYCCPGCLREKVVADQAAALDAEGGAQ